MRALLDWLNSPALVAFSAPTTWAEVLGFATGAVCVWFVARQNVWNWPLGIANNLLWIVLFASAGLYADSGLQVVYVALALWGWYQWLRGGQGRGELAVTRTTARQWKGLALAGAAGLVGLALYLEHATNSTVPLADAATTTLSLMATWGQCRKKVESWWLWITADVVYVPLYLHKGLTLTAILYVGFLALCVTGLLSWRRDLAAAPAPVPA